jgi:hypothetical protein
MLWSQIRNWIRHDDKEHFLSVMNCNLTLYHLIKNIKNQPGTFRERIRVEASCKNGRTGRYIVPILLSEFLSYKDHEQRIILSQVGYTLRQFKKILLTNRVDDNADIIFGLDGNKGKLYLDNGTDLVCYQGCEVKPSKIYRSSTRRREGISTILRVYNRNGCHIANHYRLSNPEWWSGWSLHWIAVNKNREITYYVRPGFGGEVWDSILDILHNFRNV